MKNGVALLVALVLGILGFAAMYLVLSRQSERVGAGHESAALKRVIVARKSLPAGTKLAGAHLDTRPVAADSATSLHIDESQIATVLGRILQAPVREGEPILLPALQSGGTSGAREIEGQLHEPDRLAIAIEVDLAQSLAGLIQPGQKVDVIGTFDVKLLQLLGNEVKGDSKDTITRTILLMQNRTVLAVDVITQSRYEGDPKQTTKHVVTLAVTSEEALKLALLQAKGMPHLALRHGGDPRIDPVQPIGAENLFGRSGGIR